MYYEQKLVELLARVPITHPAFLFLQLFSVHFVGELPFALHLMVLAITAAVVTRKNYFWYVGIAITPGLGPLSLINMLFGLFSLDQAWKLILFIYLVGDIYLRHIEGAWLFYNFLALLALLIWIYRQLPFNSPASNRMHFAGFGGLWFMHLTIFVMSTLDIFFTDRWYFPAVLACCSVGCSFYVISRRMQEIFNMRLGEIESASQYMLYVRHVEQQLRQPFEQVGIEKAHRQNCHDGSCSCREQDKRVSFNRLFIRQHYNWARLKFGLGRSTNYLQEYLIKTLLEQGQFPLAIEHYLRAKHEIGDDIFARVQIKRLETHLEAELAKVEQQYVIKQKFENAFDYQINHEKLRRDIRELVELKLDFWKEVAKPSSKLTVLRRLGPQILHRFNAMNDFYQSCIRPVEEEIHLFCGSIIYNLFLLVATNYQDLAQANIKQLKKSSDAPSVDQRKDTRSFYIKVSLNKQSFAIIENATSNFLKLIHTSCPKGEFIGRPMEFLIPDCYVSEHMRGMRELRGYNINNLLGINVNPIFFLDSLKRIVPCNVVVKYSMSVLNQLCVIANVKQLNDDAQYILLNHQHKATYFSNEDIDLKILEQEELRKSLQSMWSGWSDVTEPEQPYHPVPSIKLTLEVSGNTYMCVLSSPLSTSFRFPNPPPIHLSIHNESATAFDQDNIEEDAQLGNCMKKVNEFMDIRDDESKSAGGSREYQIIDVIKKVQTATVPPSISRFALGMHAVVLFGLISVVLTYFLYDGDWSSKQSPQNLCYKMLNTTYNMEGFISRAVGKGLALNAINTNYINESSYSLSYSTNNYTKDTLKQLQSVCSNLKTIVTANIRVEDTYMSANYQAVAIQPIQIKTDHATHYLSAMNLMTKCASDCIELANGVKFTNITLPQFYWKFVVSGNRRLIAAVNQSNKAALLELQHASLVITVLLLLVLLASIAPIEIVNRAIFKKENIIYELLVSTQSQLISGDMSSLMQLDSSLRKSPSSISTIPNQDGGFSFMDVRSKDMLTQNEQSSLERRKRNGEIDSSGYTRSAALLYVGLVLLVLVMVGLLLAKWQSVQLAKSRIQQQINGFEWRNGRLQLAVNIKKLLFGFNIPELLDGMTLEDWISHKIQQRRMNYVLRNSINNFTYDCGNPLLCRASSALSSELAISQYGETLLSELFLQRDHMKIGLMERLEEISSYLFEQDQQKLQVQFQSSMQFLARMKILLLMLGIVTAVLAMCVNIAFERRLKRQFIETIRMLTLLTVDMVRKNKRVQSYLLRISSTD